jgi:hypothetical protein
MAQVSRARGAAPPEAVVDSAIDHLDLQTPAREHEALLGLLGEAAEQGDEGAQAVLEQHLDDELGQPAGGPGLVGRESCVGD